MHFNCGATRLPSSPFRWLILLEASQLWDIAQARVCEVIVGILCGGMMMMILPSSSDATAL
ncbi:hypothetical protein O5264_13210 [Escherichia coli]|nr:hypothetical protein [Escherichia coli]